MQARSAAVHQCTHDLIPASLSSAGYYCGQGGEGGAEAAEVFVQRRYWNSGCGGRRFKSLRVGLASRF
jgi:hypothetical protein